MKSINAEYFTEDDLNQLGIKRVGLNVKISKNCTIVGLENISIGSNVRIDSNCVITATHGQIVLGNYIHIGAQCAILADAGFIMDDFSGLSHGVKVFTGCDDFSGEFLFNPMVPEKLTNVKRAPVALNQYALIGAGSVILPGVVISEGVAVGALSLVSKSLKSWAIYSGVPARRIRERKKDMIELSNQLKGELK